jgi:hypothetical protein
VSPDRPDTPYHSFLLRIWQEDSLGKSSTWQIEVESIQSGQKWLLSDLEKVTDFLKGHLTHEEEAE